MLVYPELLVLLERLALIKLLVLDLDDVIYRYRTGDLREQYVHAYWEGARNFANQHNLPCVKPESPNVYDAYAMEGHPLQLAFKQALLDAIPIEQLIPKDPDSLKALESLARMPLKLVILTNNTQAHAWRVLRHLGADGLFAQTDVWGTEAVQGSGKSRCSELFTALTENYRVPSDQAMMVDDKIENLFHPRRLGWQTVWMIPKELTGERLPEEHLHLPDLMALVPLLEQARARAA